MIMITLTFKTNINLDKANCAGHFNINSNIANCVGQFNPKYVKIWFEQE